MKALKTQTCAVKPLLHGLCVLAELFSGLVLDNSFFFLLGDTYRVLWDCNLAALLSKCKWDQNQGRKHMLQWFHHTDAALLPSPLWVQLMRLNSEAKLQASRCLWQDCFWPHCSSRCYLLPCCCLVEAGSTFWHWLPVSLTSIALASWQLTAEAVFHSLYKVCMFNHRAFNLLSRSAKFWSFHFLHQAWNNLS